MGLAAFGWKAIHFTEKADLMERFGKEKESQKNNDAKIRGPVEQQRLPLPLTT